MKNPWFRLYAEFATDPKVQSMSETFQRRLIMLFCLRCNGDIPGLSDSEIGCALRVAPSEICKVKLSFREKGFIDDSWQIVNWDKRQFLSDDVTKRVQRFREKKTRQGNVSETLLKRPCNGNETVPDTDTDTDTEADLKKPLTSFGTPKDAFPHSEIIELYHSILPELTRVSKWTPVRQRLLRARWKEDIEHQTLDFWAQLFNQVQRSDFLMGRVKDWKANLEWIIRPSNFTKVIEGKYANKQKGNSPQSGKITNRYGVDVSYIEDMKKRVAEANAEESKGENERLPDMP